MENIAGYSTVNLIWVAGPVNIEVNNKHDALAKPHATENSNDFLKKIGIALQRISK